MELDGGHTLILAPLTCTLWEKDDDLLFIPPSAVGGNSFAVDDIFVLVCMGVGDRLSKWVER
jgi:hypothetical protein